MLWDLLSLTSELALVLWLAAAIFWGTAGAALASWLGRPLWQGLLLGAVLPVLGPLLLLTGEAVARRRAGTLLRPTTRQRATWGRPGIRQAAIAVSLLTATGLVVVTGLRDTQVGVAGGFRVALTIRDVGLTTVTMVTLLVLVGSAVLSWRGPSRWAAVAVAWCASWWLLWAVGALLVGGTLRVLADSSGLVDDVDAVVRVGPSWTMLLALACLLLAWSAWVLDRAHRLVPAGHAGARAYSGTGAPGRPTLDTGSAPIWRPGPVSPPDPFIRPADPFARPADPFSDGR